MFLDADLGIPVEELEKFVSEIENGYDIVIASRFVPGTSYRETGSLASADYGKGFSASADV